MSWNKLEGIVLQSGSGYTVERETDTPDACQKLCETEANFKCRAFAYRRKAKNDANCRLYKRTVEREKMTCSDQWSVYELECKKPSDKNGSCDCSLGMDTHFLTYDRQRIDFTGPCTYLVTSSTIPNDKCKFRVLGRYVDRGTRIPLSTLRSIEVEFAGDRILFERDSKIYQVNGVKKRIDTCRTSGSTYYTVQRDGKNLKFYAPRCDVSVSFEEAFVEVHVPKSPYFGKGILAGLCGDCNGEKDNMVLRDGKIPKGKTNEENMAMVGASYIISKGDGKEKKCEVTPAIVCDKDTTAMAAKKDYCGLIKDTSGPFGTCAAGWKVGQTMYYESCVLDVCSNKNDPDAVKKVVCQNLQMFGDACRRVKQKYSSWRTEKFCPMPCGDKRVYKPDASACPATCADPEAPKSCKLPAKEGCECAEGHVLNGGKCIRKEDCAKSAVLDVVLVVEASKLIGEANFSCVRDMLSETLGSFVVKKDMLQAAFVPVGGKVRVALPFEISEDRDDLMRKIQKISYVGGRGDIIQALKLAKKLLEKRTEERSITEAQKMVILHVPDPIDDNDAVQEQLKDFIRMKTKVVVIVRGKEASKPRVTWARARRVILAKPGCDGEEKIPDKLVPTIEEDSKCSAGYYKNEGSCDDINECDADVCPRGAECTNTPGSFQCKCKDGFVFDKIKGCLEINECFNQPCLEGSKCRNLPGSYICECQKGLHYDDKKGCLDINECAEKSDICLNGKCQNTEGSYKCTCPDGKKFIDKVGCQDKNPCDSKPCKCGADCKASGPTKFECGCQPGFKYDKKNGCQAYNMCTEDKPCKGNSTCRVEIGGYRCLCDDSYVYEKVTGCKPIDFCARNPCKGSAQCLSKVGGFECVCKKPKVYNESIGCQDPLIVSTLEQIVFIGESTKDVGNSNFDTIKRAFKKLLDDLSGDQVDMNVGVITGGKKPQIDIEQASAPKEQIKTRIQKISFREHKKFNLKEALRIVRDVNFKSPNKLGTRILVIIAADPLDDGKRLKEAARMAKELRQKQVQIIYIGLGAQVSAQKASQITGRTDKVYLVKFPVEILKMTEDVAGNIRAYLSCAGGYVRKGTKCILSSAVDFACEDSATKTRYGARERWVKNCVQSECQTTGPVVKNTECPTASGGCVPIGSKFQCKDSQGNFRNRCSCKAKPDKPKEIEMIYLRSLDEPKVIYTKKGGKCVFPFVYRDVVHYGCTRKNHNRPWCSLTSNYDLDAKFGECKLNSGKITCQFAGKTYKEGEKWNVGCTDYKCEEEIGIRVYAKCEDSKGKCVSPSTKSFQCKIKDVVYDDCSCEETSEGHVEYFVKETEDIKLHKSPGEDVKAVSFCKIPGAGTEYKPGDTWKANCTSYKCTGKRSQPFKVTKRECQDSSGGCKAPSSTKFTCMLDGKQYKDCLCSEHENGAVTYDYTDENGIDQSHEYTGAVVVSAMCTDKTTGKSYSKGQKWMSECSVVKCLAEAGLDVAVVERRCKATDGTCVAVGAQNFPCTVDSKKYKSCTCQGGADNTVVYTVNDAKKGNGTCEDPKTNVKHAIGTSWSRDCVTFKCGGPSAQVAIVKRECMAYNGTCLAVGSSGFKCTLITKKVVENCSCRLKDDMIVYTGPETSVQTLDKAVERKKRWLDNIWPW